MDKNERFGVVRKSLTAAGVYISVVIGAGFASGQEIKQFFAKFGRVGVIGAVIAGLILAVTGWAIMDVCARENIRGAGVFLRTVLGRGFGAVMEFAVGLFVFIMFVAMLAGAGSAVHEAFFANGAFGFDKLLGACVLAAVCYMALRAGVGGIVGVTSVLAPVLVVGGAALGLWAAIKGGTAPVEVHGAALPPAATLSVLSAVIMSGFVYASYNAITTPAVLAEIGVSGRTTAKFGGLSVSEVRTAAKFGGLSVSEVRTAAKFGGLIGGGVLGLLGALFTWVIADDFAALNGFDIPMLALTRSLSGWAGMAYVAVLFAAVLTTAVANAFAASGWLVSAFGVNRRLADIAVCAGGAAASTFGFEALVDKGYRLFGYVGLLEIAVIIYVFIKGYKKGAYKYGK